MKEEKINEFLKLLTSRDGKSSYPFNIICSKCGGSDVIIYHDCELSCGSDETGCWNTGGAGLKCKGCGNASEIEKEY